MNNYKQASKSPSYYLTLAQQLHPNKHQTSASFHLTVNTPATTYSQQPYTFNKDFYPQYNKSALPQTSYHPKYRSSSQPSQCLVRNLSQNHFSYYDQLKRRDYIVGRNYQSMSQLKRDYLLARKRSYDSLGRRDSDGYGERNYDGSNLQTTKPYNAELNRFSKYDVDTKKLSKSTLANKGPLIKTNIKLYEKPDPNNRITQIHSSFQPNQSQHYTRNYPQIHPAQYQNQRLNQTPIMDCNIEVKSDDQGRYYSTVQSQFPTVMNKYNTHHNLKDNTFTTEAVLLRDYPNVFENFQPLNHNAVSQPVKNHLDYQTHALYSDKDSQTQEHKKKAKVYDTYVVRRKTSPAKGEENHLPNKSQYNHYLQSMETKPVNNLQVPQTTGPIKRKTIIEYQMTSPKKQKSPTKPQSKRKSVPKTHAQNLGLKYYYSKYYLAEQQNQKKNHNRSKSGSIRNNEKSQTKQKSKRSPSKHNTHQKSNKKISANQPKTKEKTSRPCHDNYASTHLFTAKK